MPRPGKEPLKRFHLENGPVYRHASLCNVLVSLLPAVFVYTFSTYALLHGSFAG